MEVLPSSFRDNLSGFVISHHSLGDQKITKRRLGDHRITVNSLAMEFHEKLKRICELEEINLKEFSDLTGISHGVIKNYSSGRRVPKLDQIQRMTEHPRLSQYRNFLLSLDEPIGEDPEIMALIRRCEELGIADEAADVIRALLKTAERD